MDTDSLRTGLNSLSWLILAYLGLQPVLKQRMLKHGRKLAFQAIETKRRSRVISLIHRKEVVNFLGFPVVQYLDIQDAEAVLRAIRLTPENMPIDMLLHTPAGVSLAAEQIARALTRHKARVTVFIPHYALSGGTLIALAADEIVMSSDAILGALDPTVGQFPAASIVQVIDKKKPDQISDGSLILIDQARKAMRQMEELVAFLLVKRLPQPQAGEIARLLTEGKWTQDYPITVEEAGGIGLTVSTDMPVEVLRLMSLFPQDTRRRPSVDFIPAPYSPLPSPARGSKK